MIHRLRKAEVPASRLRLPCRYWANKFLKTFCGLLCKQKLFFFSKRIKEFQSEHNGQLLEKIAVYCVTKRPFRYLKKKEVYDHS